MSNSPVATMTAAENLPYRQRGLSLDTPPVEYFIRPGSSWSGGSQVIEASPCFVLEWSEQKCTHRFLASIELLRAEIETGKSDNVQRLFVIHGLPDPYVKALRSSLDIDPAFIEAHAGRRRYRPLRWRRDAKFAHYEYPEIVSGFDKAVLSHFFESVSLHGASTLDLLGDPQVKAISDVDDLAAVFCHASLWITNRADVLFLDRPIWRDPASPLRKATRRASVTKPYSMRPWSSDGKKSSWDVRLADGDEMPSLEDSLQETLKDAAEIGDELINILAELAYDHWLEFFQALTPHQQPKVHDCASLYWQISQSLEQNLDVGRYLGRQNFQLEATYPDWIGLLLRTQRRIELLPTILPRLALPKTSTRNWNKNKVSQHNTLASATRSSRQSNRSSDENQRSLDRVTYLGGILLPFSIVSGVLSMNDDFEPGAQHFWVFWAIAIPMAIFALLVIYADILRKAEVWVEVAAETISPQLASSTPVKVEQQDQKPHPPGEVSAELSSVRFQSIVPAAPGAIPHAITYSAGDDVVLDIENAQNIATAEEALEEEEEGEDEDAQQPTMILERPSNGSHPRAWKRQQLGWFGACKQIFGLVKPRKAIDPPLGVPAYDKQAKRRTKTF